MVRYPETHKETELERLYGNALRRLDILEATLDAVRVESNSQLEEIRSLRPVLASLKEVVAARLRFCPTSPDGHDGRYIRAREALAGVKT